MDASQAQAEAGAEGEDRRVSDEVPRPDWRHAYVETYVAIRDQLRAERRCGGREMSERDIDAHAWREAERRTQEAIRRWNERASERNRKLGRAA